MFMFQAILVNYLIAINLATFLIFWRDKFAAIQKRRRIPEKKLLRLCYVWGIIWWYFGMYLFRHKSIKHSFLRKFYITLGIYLIGMLFLLWSVYL